MSDLRFSLHWLSSNSGAQELRHTAAQLGIFVDETSLTRSVDLWSQTVRDEVAVSAYPLAMWFASSWWRLNHESLPLPGQQPSHDWRMAHELGAANHGFVWPRVLFASDGEAVNVWAAPTRSQGQSVQYLQGLDHPRTIALDDFQQSVRNFIHSVLSRLGAKERPDTDLASLWALVQEDIADSEVNRRRKLEAELGFDPEECPPDLLDAALDWQQRIGGATLTELAPMLSSGGNGPDLSTLQSLIGAKGLQGAPEVGIGDIDHSKQCLPWQRAVHAARSLRQHLRNADRPITDPDLYGLLGLTTSQVSNWRTEGRPRAAVAIPEQGNRFRFMPRRRNHTGQRFEFARFLGDHLRPTAHAQEWLASTDLATSRQRYQRAFAAEFLCPIDALTDFLSGDFSESTIEEASDRFKVSDQTVRSLLSNNGHITPSYWDQSIR
jgi:hypothetical protein